MVDNEYLLEAINRADAKSREEHGKVIDRIHQLELKIEKVDAKVEKKFNLLKIKLGTLAALIATFWQELKEPIKHFFK